MSDRSWPKLAPKKQPEARLRAPSAAEPAGARGDRGEILSDSGDRPSGSDCTSHVPGKARDVRAAIRRSVVHVFEPASERGTQGTYTTNCSSKSWAVPFSFKKLKSDVFDAQLAFNMLARYGEEAAEPLEGIEQRVERHLAFLLTGWPGVPMPSLRLIQAPVFHGHSISAWVEFEENPGMDVLTKKLAASGIDVRPDEPPTNAAIAGQSGLSAGAIAIDRNNPRACWFWLVTDNLRLAAENAVAVGQGSSSRRRRMKYLAVISCLFGVLVVRIP